MLPKSILVYVTKCINYDSIDSRAFSDDAAPSADCSVEGVAVDSADVSDAEFSAGGSVAVAIVGLGAGVVGCGCGVVVGLGPAI